MQPTGTIAVGLLTVPTVTFDVLSVFFVVSLERRRVLHIDVTAHPYVEWAAQPIVEVVGFDTSIARLLRDRDRIHGARVDARVDNLGIRPFRVAPRAAWQNGFAERSVGALRRDVLDHVIVLGERHLLRLVQEHARYDSEDRPHMAVDGDEPVSRVVDLPGSGQLVSLPRVGGLHHRYSTAA